jgi:oligopeptide transport system substrate-binding protein
MMESIGKRNVFALRLTRRGLLRNGAFLGVGGSIVATLLAACGGSSNSTATTASGGSTTATTASGGSTTASASTAASTGSVDLAADQTLRLPAGEPATMDPEVTSGGTELDVIFNVFDGLVGVNQNDGKVEPHLAEKFEANSDASAFTFHVKTGLKWSDGSPLNAHDFEWSWKRVLKPETKSAYVPALYPIKGVVDAVTKGGSIDAIGVKATDDNTLQVTLEAPTPFFNLLATTWTFYPVPQVVIDKQGEKWTEAANIISTGPYIMTDWKHNESITLEQNPNYWGAKPTITKVIYSLFQDYISQGIVAYENNELDFCNVPASDFQRVKADPTESKEIISITASYTRFVICDCTNAPTSDINFRQALSMSVDRKTLTDQVRHGQVVPAPTLLPPDMPGYNPDATIGEDLAQAKALLAKAGITDPSTVKLSMVYISTDDYKLDAEYLQQTWNKNLGITITLEPVESTAYNDWRASRATAPFNIYIGNWGSDFEDPSNWYNQNFTHASDHYRSHWNDPEFDKAVATAATNTNADERVQQYKDASKVIATQSPVIPLYHDVNYYLAKPYVKNLHLQPLLSSVHAQQVSIAKH